MLIIMKWLGAMQFVKDVSLVRFIPNLRDGSIILTFISSPRTKSIVLVHVVRQKLVTKVGAIGVIMIVLLTISDLIWLKSFRWTKMNTKLSVGAIDVGVDGGNLIFLKIYSIIFIQ